MSAAPALLAYAVTPSSVPYTRDPGAPSLVTLMVTATNPPTRDRLVTCSRLDLAVHAGPRGGDLASDASGIEASAALETGWSIVGNGDGTFTALPLTTPATLAPGDSIAFFLARVRVNGVAGSGQIEVWEDGRNAPPLGIAKTPPGLGITSFRATPVQVLPGSRVALVWTTTGAESCTLSWPGGSVHKKPDDHHQVTPEETAQYTLTATGGGESIAQSLTVVVPAPRVLSFAATPRAGIALGGEATLAWRVANASTVTVQPGAVDGDPREGSLTVKPTQSTPYALEVGTGAQTLPAGPAWVNVNPVAIDAFTAEPAAPVWPGEPVTLRWKTRWASSRRIDPVLGEVEEEGSRTVPASARTTYTLTADGLAPKTARCVVEALPWFRRLVLEPGPGALVLRWEADADTVSGGPPSGATVVDGMGSALTLQADLRAERGGRRSRVVVDVAASSVVRVPGVGDFSFPSVPAFALVPRVVLAGDDGLNRPGAVVRLETAGAIEYGALVEAWGVTSPIRLGGGASELSFPLLPVSRGEPWVVRADLATVHREVLHVRGRLMLAVYPAE